MTQVEREVVIVGGGISGATVGVALRLLGIRTRLKCRHWIEDIAHFPEWLEQEPRFASQYPAASVIPHNVDIENSAWHTEINQQLFSALIQYEDTGVRTQRHFEVFEFPQRANEFATQMPEFRPLPEDGSGEQACPRRSPELPIFGWNYRVLFAEMQRYRSFIGSLYRNLGGTVETGSFCTLDEIVKLGADTVINCGGAWGPALAGDAQQARFVFGTLVRVNANGLIPRNRVTGEICSYNYSALRGVFDCADGTPTDLYFYPRSDGLLLGGTRFQSEQLSCSDMQYSEQPPRWRGEVWSGGVSQLPHFGRSSTQLSVPEPIVHINRDIIAQLTGFDLSNHPLEAMTGYRFKRNKVRLDETTHGSTRILHNYGHGGAGVTLSWSCALSIAAGVLGRNIEAQELIEALQRVLRS
jgi:D-amino-acid oxidase